MLDDFKYTSLIFSYGCFPVITSYLLSEKTESYKTNVWTLQYVSGV